MAASEHSSTAAQRFGFKNISSKSDEFTSGTGPGAPASYRPVVRDNRSMSGGAGAGAKPMLAHSTSLLPMPGSFNTELRSTAVSRSTTPQNEAAAGTQLRPLRTSLDEDRTTSSEHRQALVRDKIAKELKIKMGTENMLEALLTKNAKQTKEQRYKVEMELGTSNRKLAQLKLELETEMQRAQTPSTPPSARTSSYLRGSPLKSPPVDQIVRSETHDAVDVADTESPTVVLTETLQALEVEGMQPDYYIDRANTLVALFKRNPTLKYDLAWPVFSDRVQLMLLSESSDVVAAGYRLTRYAITDRSSLQTIRGLHTDELVTLSIIKKGKAVLEREQAVKFVRAFLDVPQGHKELSRGVVRSLVAVAETPEDRLQTVCLLTLAELLTKSPALLVSANGLSTLTEAMSEGTFPAPEGLVTSFLQIVDKPCQRRFLNSGRELEAMFAPFTDPLLLHGDEEKLKTCAKGIAAILKSWPGFLTLAMNGASSLRSLIESLVYPDPFTRDLVLELLFDVLRIKPPSWSSTFLAGRRLTTYGRVAPPVQTLEKKSAVDHDTDGRFDLTAHFTAVVLAVLLKVGLVPGLTELVRAEDNVQVKRKATLLLTEVLKLAHHSLPSSMSAEIQVLPDLMSPILQSSTEIASSNVNMIYQINSINITLNRTGAGHSGKMNENDELAVGPQASERSRFTAATDSEAFRQAVIDSGVTSHTQYVKWNWNLINSLIEGPLTNPKRLEESMKNSKFMKRLVGFYRPFKYRFSTARNTRPNQRYVRTGCALVRSLCQTTVGLQYLSESKLMRQIAECLAQVDPQSGLTSESPFLDKANMASTLSGGYFSLLGALSESMEGIQIMERWRMMNMFYHVIDLRDREDLVKAMLGNMNFSLDTHLRVMLSKALTAARREIRLYATRLLRKYAVGRVKYRAGMQDPDSSHWALCLVLTQLYDPEVEVCEVAVKILEEACDQPGHLEYVVKCRPALDHLGEIGAPLLLRFLSISTGYHYLNGLDYIHQEMDDWFLGRNDTYVAQVEASLARAYMDPGLQKLTLTEDLDDYEDIGLLPAHFYRELARTEEGCKLLRQSGHFYEFASTIRDFRLEDEDVETLTKIKGCLWAVGNIGSMELGAPFLEESGVVRLVVRIAEGAAVLSVRGTACFALGLLSITSHGFTMLTECGWDITTNAAGKSLGFCLPRDPTRLCLNGYGPSADINSPNTKDLERYQEAISSQHPVHSRILRSIVDMGNSVMYKKVAGDLHGFKTRCPEAFTDVSLFQKTLIVLDCHHFRLSARQFVLDLFDKSVMRRIVLEADGEDESGPDA